MALSKVSLKDMAYLGWALGPVLGFLAAIFLGPFIYMIWLSVTDLSFALVGRDGNFIGLSNYVRAMFEDEIFLGSLGRSFVFAFYCVSPQVVIGVIVAETLYKNRAMQRFLAPLFVLPALLPSVVIGLYWRIMLQGDFGLISHYFFKWGFSSAQAILSTPETILFTLAAIDIWQWGPFVALVFLAKRGSLPRAPLEAALVDGASRIRAFVDVTLPALLPTVFVVALIRAIDSFKEFDKVFIMTGGGPGNASELSSIYIWRMAFKHFEFGYAAALCVLVYIIIYGSSRFLLAKSRSRSAP